MKPAAMTITGRVPSQPEMQELPPKDEIWTTRDGRKIAVGDMEESHVRDALRMVIRNHRRRVLRVAIKRHIEFCAKHDIDDPFDNVKPIKESS